MIQRGAVWAAAAILAGCGFASDAPRTAPEECGFGDSEVEWSGTGTLEQLGLHADSEFPHREVGDAFIVRQADGAASQLFCFTLEHGDPQGEPLTVRAPVPVGWTPP